MKQRPRPKFLLWIVGLSIFSFWTVASAFVFNKSLCWDNKRFFSFFRDNLYSLNQFGEIAWWFPHQQSGWPGYYYSILGDLSCASPLFACLGAIYFFLGKLGIHFQSYHLTYVIYASFLSPLLFLASLYFFTRQFFKSPYVIAYVLIVGAFSPGVVFNASDIGFLEPLAYGLFFFTAYICWLRNPCRESFLALALSSSVLALSLNYSFFFWNLLAIPFFIIYMSVLSKEKRAHTKNALASVPLASWLLLVVSVGICFLPNLFAFQQGSEMLRSSTQSRYYDFTKLEPGVFLEALFTSVPGLMRHLLRFGVEKSSDYSWYFYTGMWTLPLAVLALIYAKPSIRRFFLTALIVFFGAINLASYSPFFAPVLALPTPIAGISHYGDALFRSGGFLIFVFLAAFGLNQWLETRSWKIEHRLCTFFIVSGIGSFIAMSTFRNKGMSEMLIFNLMWLLALLFLVVTFWVKRAASERQRRIALNFFLVLHLVDVSTYLFIHSRNTFYTLNGIQETVSADGFTLADPELNFRAGELLLHQQKVEMERAGLSQESFPAYQLFAQVHRQRSVTDEKQIILERGFGSYDSLAITSSDLPKMIFPHSKTRDLGLGREVRKTFTSLDLTVDANRPVVLFIRDSYSPYWKATINGVPTHIARALFHSKAIMVPKGSSTIHLSFSPPWIALSIAGAYLVVFGLGLGWLLCVPRPRLAFLKLAVASLSSNAVPQS